MIFIGARKALGKYSLAHLRTRSKRRGSVRAAVANWIVVPVES
jgi:hypothetical protein